MKFRMYSNTDSSKETVTIIEASSIEDAENILSKVKELPVESFKKLYSVELYERR